jgi:hypothetical protein
MSKLSRPEENIVTDAVLGDRFRGARNEPAWHGKGTVDGDECDARESLRRIGNYKVVMAPLVTASKLQSTGEQFDVQQCAILRQPLPEDDMVRVFGVVSPGYELIDPDRFARILDESIHLPVDAMMALRNGELMVATYKLPEFNLAGEANTPFLVCGNWCSGSDANTAMLTLIRAVCQNTYNAGLKAATESRKFTHDATIEGRMKGWLSGVVERATGHVAEVKAMGETLAAFKLSSKAQLATVLAAAYPKPEAPDVRDLPDSIAIERMARYEVATKVVDERRVTAEELFRGAGTGMRTVACWGTGWGLYQAVCEVEDYRKGAAGAGLASSILYGERSATKDRALSALQTMVGAVS